MRALIVGLALLAAACNPASQAPGDQSASEGAAGQAGSAEAPDPERDAMAAALAAPASADIGRPVTFQVTTKKVEGDWGFLVAQPWTPEGAQLDWSATRYAEQAREGALDGNGTTYALLHRQNGTWTVTAFAVGPTDVAYADWSERYGAPAAIFETN